MSGQAYGHAGAGPGGCATDTNGCLTAAGILLATAVVVALVVYAILNLTGMT